METAQEAPSFVLECPGGLFRALLVPVYLAIRTETATPPTLEGRFLGFQALLGKNSKLLQEPENWDFAGFCGLSSRFYGKLSHKTHVPFRSQEWSKRFYRVSGWGEG